MEAGFGHDFSDVRLHTDGAASESARAINAQAYTVGSDVVFQSDRYSPGTDEGKHTLAHELAHVVQQRSGPVDGTPTGTGISVSHPSDRFERAAEHVADQVVSAKSASSAPSVQTSAEDELAAHTGVQRQSAEPEEEPKEEEA
jgi:hypothetical protein